MIRNGGIAVAVLAIVLLAWLARPASAPRRAPRRRRTSSSSCGRTPPTGPPSRGRHRAAPGARRAGARRGRRERRRSATSSPRSSSASPRTSPRCSAAGWWSAHDDARPSPSLGVRKAAILLIQLGRDARRRGAQPPRRGRGRGDLRRDRPARRRSTATESEAVLTEFARDGDRPRAHRPGRPRLRPAAARAVARRRAGRRDHGPAPGGRGADAVPVPAPRRPRPAALVHRRRAPAGDRAGARPHDARQGVARARPGCPRSCRPRSRTGSR